MHTPTRTPRLRSGFTLVEMIVVLAIIITLAAVILAQVANQTRRGGTAALAQDLNAVSTAVASFRSDVRRYPSSLAQLTRPLVTGDLDVCGGNMPAVVRARWRGPYLQRAVPATGLRGGDATILNPLLRDPASGNPFSAGTLFITAVNVDRDAATDLETQFDGNADFSGGTIRWVSGGAAGDTLRFAIPVRGC